MNFGAALDALKNGAKVARSGWNGRGMFVVHQRGYPDGIPINANTAEATGIPQGTVCGRIVHYVSHGTPGGEYASQCRAAIVTGVPEGALPLADKEHAEEWDSSAVVLDLAVLNPTGAFFNRCAQSEDDHRGGSWHWPERV